MSAEPRSRTHRLLYLDITGCTLVTSDAISECKALGINISYELCWRARKNPSPDLLPREVCELQILSLRSDGNRTTEERSRRSRRRQTRSRGINEDELGPSSEVGEGVRVCFGFASPANQSATGPLEHFAHMLHASYGIMFAWDRYGIEEIPLSNHANMDAVCFQVHFVRYRPGDPRKHWKFRWYLERQGPGVPFSGCWMTSSVAMGGSREGRAL